jgi:hypothetical protein
MTSAKAVSAQFEAIPQLPLNVTLSGSGQGAVGSFPGGLSCPGSCSGAFDEGSTVYLLAAPAPGSQFAGFSGGGCGGTATVCAVTMAGIQNVSATFTGTAAGPAQALATTAKATARTRLHRRRRAWRRHHQLAIGGAQALDFDRKGR